MLRHAQKYFEMPPHSYSAVACALRYRAPFKPRYLVVTHPHHRHLLRHPRPRLPPAAPVSSFYRFPTPSLYTGSSLFPPMERFCSGSTLNGNDRMINLLKSIGVINSEVVAEVMRSVDRALFVPKDTPPYDDCPMSIGYNVTISAPHMHAMCLELLKDRLQPGMHALDIGSGTGYLTACFAQMVGPHGRAVGVEHIPELVALSVENVEKSAASPLLKEGSLSLHVGDGRNGWPESAPYDAIHVGAAAGNIPKPLIDQLKPGGRLVIPVGDVFQELMVVDKDPDGQISEHRETSVRYVPLTSREAQLRRMQ